MKTGAKRRRFKAQRARAARAAGTLAQGGRHRIDISEHEAVEVSRLHTPLSRVTEAVNPQLQTPEAWARVWADELAERGQ